MRKLILFATSYPYTTGIIGVIWLGSVLLLRLDPTMSLDMVLVTNVGMTLLIAAIGFRR